MQLQDPQAKYPQSHLRALKVQGPKVQVHEVWASVPALPVRLWALSSGQCPWCLCCILPLIKRVVSLCVLVLLHGVAGTQRLQISATEGLNRLSLLMLLMTLFCFVPLLAPAAS